MTTNLPDPAANLHLAQLDYYFTIGQLTAAEGPVTFAVPDPVRFSFPFETGSVVNPDGSVTMTWDYSWFDQTATEASLVTALNTILSPIAALLGLATGIVEAAATVKRVWTYAPNTQGPGVGSGRIASQDIMTYPPADNAPAGLAAGAGTAGAASGGF